MRSALLLLTAAMMSTVGSSQPPQVLPGHISRWDEDPNGPTYQLMHRCRVLEEVLREPHSAKPATPLLTHAEALEADCRAAQAAHPDTTTHRALLLWSRALTNQAMEDELRGGLAPLLPLHLLPYGSESGEGLRRPISQHIEASHERSAAATDGLAVLTDDLREFEQ